MIEMLVHVYILVLNKETMNGSECAVLQIQLDYNETNKIYIMYTHILCNIFYINNGMDKNFTINSTKCLKFCVSIAKDNFCLQSKIILS